MRVSRGVMSFSIVALAALALIGPTALAEKSADDVEPNGMSNMMDGVGMMGMMGMMSEMMDHLDSSEGNEMIAACQRFMDSFVGEEAEAEGNTDETQ